MGGSVLWCFNIDFWFFFIFFFCFSPLPIATHTNGERKMHLLCRWNSVFQSLPANDPTLSVTYPFLFQLQKTTKLNILPSKKNYHILSSISYLGANQDPQLAVAVGFKWSPHELLPLVCWFSLSYKGANQFSWKVQTTFLLVLFSHILLETPVFCFSFFFRILWMCLLLITCHFVGSCWDWVWD